MRSELPKRLAAPRMTSSPAALTSGPPRSPWVMAQSVCTARPCVCARRASVTIFLRSSQVFFVRATSAGLCAGSPRRQSRLASMLASCWRSPMLATLQVFAAHRKPMPA